MMERAGLTPKMNECLQFIKTYIDGHDGVAPSYDEIKKHLGLKAKGGVVRLVDSLEERGWITRRPYLGRSISVIRDDEITQIKSVYELPPQVELALRTFCQLRGERCEAVVADAVALFIDNAEADPT